MIVDSLEHGHGSGGGHHRQRIVPGGTDEIEAEKKIGTLGAGMDVAPDRRARDAHVGGDRSALLCQAGLIDAGRVQPAEVRRHLHDARGRHDAGAPDARHADDGLTRPGPLRWIGDRCRRRRIRLLRCRGRDRVPCDHE